MRVGGHEHPALCWNLCHAAAAAVVTAAAAFVIAAAAGIRYLNFCKQYEESDKQLPLIVQVGLFNVQQQTFLSKKAVKLCSGSGYCC